MKICCKCTHLWPDLEKCSITSLVHQWTHTVYCGYYGFGCNLKALGGEIIFIPQNNNNNNVLKLNITSSDNIVILATQHNNIIQQLFHFFITIQIALIVLLGHISLFHKKSHIVPHHEHFNLIICLSTHCEKKCTKILTLGVQQLVTVAVPSKRHLCTLFP